jgi:Holliday junction resolvase RusA-like endonuclease
MQTVFIVRGAPTPKARPRSAIGRDSTGVVGIMVRTPGKTKRYEQDVATAAKAAHGSKPLFIGAISVSCEFRMPITESWPEGKRMAAAGGLIHHISKPDKDNLEKAVFDACNGVIWKDDCQIVAGTFSKVYSLEPCAIVTVESLE